MNPAVEKTAPHETTAATSAESFLMEAFSRKKYGGFSLVFQPRQHV
jgi:hypothetical protein